MAKNRLLDRQISLLNYLTSGGAIFGDVRGAPVDPALRGIEPALLRLEARFSHEKRMEKIVSIFVKTFELLGTSKASIVREFVETSPPVDISRLANARQFYGFLSAHWRCKKRKLPYLPDVAACELVCAMVRARVEEALPETAGKQKNPRPRDIRRARSVALLRCAYDIRPIFEHGRGRPGPTKRDTPLAIAMPSGADQPQVFEVLPVVFHLLAALDDWTEPTSLSAEPGLGELIADLADRGLLEVCR
jgi:hypothetical protein